MQVDVLIVGQGISGTCLSWFLQQEKKSFYMIDDAKAGSSSRIAAGIINPVTGRRYVTTWMIDEVMNLARTTYANISSFLNTSVIEHRNVIDFFPTLQMQEAFIDRLAEETPYIRTFPNQNSLNDHFHYAFGVGEICPCYTVRLGTIIDLWRQHLSDQNCISTETFNVEDLQLTSSGITYHHITADKIIFCDGHAAMENPWFKNLPFAPNKGEVLLIETELPEGYSYKRGMLLTQVADHLYWFGASNEWDYQTSEPTDTFRNKAEHLLKSWLKKPFKVVDHLAAIRPATIERRPFVGFHPLYPSLGLLNGMGSKGSSLAPFFAHQLVQNIIYNFPLTAEADIKRFNRILLNP